MKHHQHRINAVEVDNACGMLIVAWDDGMRKSFHPLWLRDNCHCSNCRHPNGQKLIDVSDLPAGVRVAAATRDGGGDGVRLCFAPDGHAARFDAAWLRDFAADAAPSKKLWDAEALSMDMVAREYAAVAGGGEALGEWLALILRYGFAVLRGAPTEPAKPATVCAVVEWFGYVRETNYGKLFEVKAVAEPNNLAFTDLGLAVHTDNPYRDPPPALQLLHCLKNTATGGDSMVVDGFKAAQILQRENAAHYDALARHAVPFQFRDRTSDRGADLQNRLPVLEVATDATRKLHAVNFNNRALGAIDIALDAQAEYYAAYRHFAEILRRDDRTVRFKMRAGDLFIVDNRRVLHGRAGFTSGDRHLQGCYADADALLSTWRILNTRSP